MWKFLRDDTISFVPSLRPRDSALKTRYETTAKEYMNEYSFGIYDNEAVKQPQLVCWSRTNELQRSTTELDKVNSLENFVKLCSTQLIPHLTRKSELEWGLVSFSRSSYPNSHLDKISTNRSLIDQSRKSLVYFYFDGNERQQFERDMLPLAKNYEEYIQFMISYGQGHPETATGRKLKDVLLVFNPNTGDYFPYRGPSPWKPTANEMEAWLVDIIKGRVKPESVEKVGDEGREHEEL